MSRYLSWCAQTVVCWAQRSACVSSPSSPSNESPTRPCRCGDECKLSDEAAHERYLVSSRCSSDPTDRISWEYARFPPPNDELENRIGLHADSPVLDL
eukprot:6207524-Pleurochrysis_carterae.AAC.1